MTNTDSDDTPRDATTIYREIDDAINDSDFHGSNLSVSYTRESNSSGKPADHFFILTGMSIEDYSNTFFNVMDEITTELDPASVLIDSSAKGPHITFAFDKDRVENTPPEPRQSYRTPEPHDAVSQTVHECSGCRRRAPDAYPPLTLRYREDSPYATGNEEHHYMCVRCSPAHFDDVVRKVEAFGVSDGEVEQFLIGETQYYDEDDDRMKTEPPQWHKVDEVDNPYIEDAVLLIERSLL